MPDFAIEVTSNAPEIAAAFAQLADRQIPFATAVALTRMAQDARLGVQVKMPHRFRLHSRRLLNGIRIQRAEKRDWPNCVAKVGTVDEFMVPQELGGEKRAEKGASHVAVPTRIVTTQRTATGAVPQRLKPRNVPKGRKIPGESIRGRLSVTKSATGKRLDDARFWLLRRSVRIKPRWEFRETVESVAAKSYAGHFERELLAAVKSARVREGSFSSEQGRMFYLRARDLFG